MHKEETQQETPQGEVQQEEIVKQQDLQEEIQQDAFLQTENTQKEMQEEFTNPELGKTDTVSQI